MGKTKIVDKDDWEFCGLRIEHAREIIDLILDGRETNKDDIELVTHILEPNVYNGYKGERLTINIPIKLNSRDKEFFKHGYEIHIYDNGYICFDNGMGSKMSFNKPLKIYKILVDNFKPAQ